MEILISVVALIICFIPVIISVLRKHNKMIFINGLIMVGGFTMSLLADVNVNVAVIQMVLLWAIALVWSLNKDVSPQ